MINAELKNQLVEAAIEVRQHAYAPYSHFQVGAALVCEDGSIYRGCNIENASFGLTICAERVAIGNSVSAGNRSIEAICIVSEGAASPCGACRQFINEFNSQTKIILVDASNGTINRELDIGQLLPDSFKL